MANRRDFLRLTAAGAAALPLAAQAAGLPGAVAGPEAEPAAGAAAAAGAAGGAPADAAWLFAPLGPGSDLGNNWLLGRVSPLRDGAVTVTLVHRAGGARRVDLCALEGAPKGPAASTLCDFLVMDGGQGDTPADEDFARALRRLAATAAENEAAHPDAVAALAGLQPLAERATRHREALFVPRAGAPA